MKTARGQVPVLTGDKESALVRALRPDGQNFCKLIFYEQWGKKRLTPQPFFIFFYLFFKDHYMISYPKHAEGSVLFGAFLWHASV